MGPVPKTVAIAIASLLLVGSAGGLLLTLDGGRDQPATGPTTTTRPLSATAKELLTLLERRDDETYHGKYEGKSPEATVTLETWQDPPRVRQDSVVALKSQTAETRVLLLPSGTVRCTQLPSVPWTCRRDTSTASLDPLAGVRARISEGEVTARFTSIAGREVRCFRFSADGASTELCLDPKRGIPVTVTGGGSRLTLVSLSDEVPDVFDPPANVAA